MNTRKHFFTVRVTEHWDRLPREAVESLSSEILKSCLAMLLGNQLSAEKDWGIPVDSKPNISQQCAPASLKQTMTWAKSRTAIKLRDVIIQCYLALVRQHQQHKVQFWSLQFKTDIEIKRRGSREQSILCTEAVREECPRHKLVSGQRTSYQADNMPAETTIAYDVKATPEEC
ncbi:LOW QUALITY PROTEIN: hypothetical protein QYF61_022897, partial [Mycteria americana]